MPSGCEAMTIAARTQDENAIVWRRDHELPPVQQGVKLLGTPLGHAAFVEDQLAKLSVSDSVLFERIQAVTDLQVAWLLLLLRGITCELLLARGASAIGAHVRRTS